MSNRRHFLTAGLSLAVAASLSRHAGAQVADRASLFIRQMGDRMTGVVNGPGALADKRRALTQILDGAVDVEEVARFCLGRFWRQASPDQQKRYLATFHDVLASNIAAKLGEYKGVKFAVLRSRAKDANALVTTVVERPNSPPATVEWEVEQPNGNPRIVDVVAEGTSLRLTQRQDYTAYLARNNNDIEALIVAMRQQAGSGG